MPADTVKHTPPDRIRVEQDADGFWTCREAISGSQEYVRADSHDKLVEALEEARTFIEAEYRDPSAEPDGEWLAKDARPVHALICAALSKAEGRE